MPAERKKLPSVLMILLSTLGILISLLLSFASFLGSNLEKTNSLENQMFTSLGVLALVFSLLNIPALVYSIRDIRGKESTPKRTSLFRSANYGLILWAILLAAGTILNRNYPYTPWLAPITIVCVLIPIWWLIEFGRRGLKRPAPLYEWKTLTIGLTLAPVTILIIETLLVIPGSGGGHYPAGISDRYVFKFDEPGAQPGFIFRRHGATGSVTQRSGPKLNDFICALPGHRSVGTVYGRTFQTPGRLAFMETAHGRAGRLYPGPHQRRRFYLT